MCRLRHALVRCAVLALVALPAGGGPGGVRAAENPCDPALPPLESNPYGYRLRGDRCEGLYAREVGAASLALVSLTETFADYDARSGRPLIVEWSPPARDTAIHLRAVGLRRRLYYRMDAIRPAGTTAYEWSPGLLSALGITRPELGIVGSARLRVGALERTVYLPVRVAQQSRPPRGRAHALLVMPGAEASEVFVSIAPVGADGRPLAFLRDGQPLGHGYYPAERGVEIPLTGLPAPGIYYVEIAATFRAGETASLALWLQHPGEG
jgi:hypothetical protein